MLAGRFAQDGQLGWARYSRLTGILFAVGFAAIASGSDGPVIVLAFTAAVLLGWSWLTAVSAKL